MATTGPSPANEAPAGTTNAAATQQPPPQRTNMLSTLLAQPHARLRLALLVPALTGLILSAAASGPHISGEAWDDGLGYAFVFLSLIVYPISITCELALLLVPLLPRFRRLRFPFINRPSQSQGGDADVEDGKYDYARHPQRPQMHPAVPLSFEVCVGGMAVAMAVVCALITSVVLEGALLGSLVMLFVVAVGHGVLAGLAARDVHRLRREQRGKRGSFRAAAAAAAGAGNGGRNEEQAFDGWVELEGPRGGGGAGGALGGKGGGL